MQTHQDSDFRAEWLDSLKAKADRIAGAGGSTITAGTDDEQPLNQWKRRGIEVRELPADEHGILRISVGGGEDTPVSLNYCVFRGNHAKCVDLLRNALIALQEGPTA
jgi:hypothetical protein